MPTKFTTIGAVALAVGAVPALAQSSQPIPSVERPVTLAQAKQTTSSEKPRSEGAAALPADRGSSQVTIFDRQRKNQWMAGSLIGRTLAKSDGTPAGTVKDLVLDGNGQVAAIVIEVGGFLGIGSRHVAVLYSAIDRKITKNGLMTLTVSKDMSEMLEKAPEFQTLAQQRATLPPASGLGAAPRGDRSEQPQE